MKSLKNWFSNEESGQGMVEYGLIIALIAVLMVVALSAVKGGLDKVFASITSKMDESSK